MKELRLSELFEIEILDLNRLLQYSVDTFVAFDYDKRICDFVKPVILISTIKPVTIQYVKDKIEFGRRVYCLLNVAPDVVSTKFVYYYLCGNRDLLDNYYMGFTIQNLALTDLRDIRVKIPSMPEQMESVKRLDVLEKLMCDRIECMSKLGEIFPAYYEKVFSVNAKFWEKKKVTDFSKKKIYDSSKHGLEVIPKENGVFVNLGKRVFYKVNREVCNPYFLAAALKNEIVKMSRRNGAWTSIGYYGLSLSHLEKCFIPLPNNMEQQNDFQILYEKLEQIKDNMDCFMYKLQNMYEYYLFKLFYRDSLSKGLSQSLLKLTKLGKTIERYSYKNPYSFSSLMAYDEARLEEYNALNSETHKQVFDEKTGKISIVYP